MTNPLHIYFLLDRSGSMESIRADVIGGFNTFVAEQKALPDPAVMTLIQFDSQDANEVIFSATPLDQVDDLTVDTFVPRGGTPLYDAMGQAITAAQIRWETRNELGQPEDIVFVTFTDGGENQSRNYDRPKVFELVKNKESDGWTFVYLGANQDAYGEASNMGVAYGGTQNFKGDAVGTAAAYRSLSSNLTRSRTMASAGGQSVSSYLAQNDFFETKEAEEELEEDKA